MRSLLGLLTADGKPVCLDARTRGKPLTIFRTMTAPDPTRTTLAWFAPEPLRPKARLSGREIFDEQIRSEHVVLTRPRQSTRVLPSALQAQLNRAASQLALYQDADAVTVPESATAPLSKSRWWIRNRLDSSCSPVYTISNPVVAKNIAFLTVTADHWGTTYAFLKRDNGWSPIAQWTNWMY